MKAKFSVGIILMGMLLMITGTAKAIDNSNSLLQFLVKAKFGKKTCPESNNIVLLLAQSSVPYRPVWNLNDFDNFIVVSRDTSSTGNQIVISGVNRQLNLFGQCISENVIAGNLFSQKDVLIDNITIALNRIYEKYHIHYPVSQFAVYKIEDNVCGFVYSYTLYDATTNKYTQYVYHIAGDKAEIGPDAKGWFNVNSNWFTSPAYIN